METIVVPNIDVIRRRILIRFVAKLGNGSNGILVVRNLNQNSTLLAAIIKVVGIPQMVFTNLILTTPMNRIANRPLMNSMVARGYRSENVGHLKGGTENQLL